MTANLTDEQLIRKSLDGDNEAFGEIVKRWERKIFALCYGMLGCKEEALDVTQETFMLAYRSLQSFRGEAKISSWLHRIALNQCLTKMRSKKNSAEEINIESEPSLSTAASKKAVSPPELVETKERAELVRKPLNRYRLS